MIFPHQKMRKGFEILNNLLPKIIRENTWIHPFSKERKGDES